MIEEKGSDRVIGVFYYNPVLPKIVAVIVKHYKTMILDNPELIEPFPKTSNGSIKARSKNIVQKWIVHSFQKSSEGHS